MHSPTKHSRHEGGFCCSTSWRTRARALAARAAWRCCAWCTATAALRAIRAGLAVPDAEDGGVLGVMREAMTHLQWPLKENRAWQLEKVSHCSGMHWSG